jgi:hypothetical protein
MQPMKQGGFAAELTSTGVHVFSTGFGNTKDDQEAQGIAVDAAGNFFVSGRFSGAMDFGKGPLTSLGLSDIFLAKFDSSGNSIWSHGFGDGSDQASVAKVTAANGGTVLVGGSYQGGVDFGGGLIPSLGSDDLFLAKFDDAGNHLFSLRAGDPASQRAAGLGAITAIGPSSALLVGAFQGKMSAGATTLTSAGDDDGFVALLKTP